MTQKMARLVIFAAILASCGVDAASSEPIAISFVEPQVVPEADFHTNVEPGEGATEAAVEVVRSRGEIGSDATNVRHVASADTGDGVEEFYRWRTYDNGFLGFGSLESMCWGTRHGAGCVAVEPDGFMPILWFPHEEGAFNLAGMFIDDSSVPFTEWLRYPEDASTLVVTLESGLRVGSDVVDGMAWISHWSEDDMPVSLTIFDSQGAELVYIGENGDVRDVRRAES